MGKEAADEIIVSLVQKYDTEKVQKKGVETIKKILDNILKYPTEQKYRYGLQNIYIIQKFQFGISSHIK